MNSIPIILLGVGSMGKNHLRLLSSMPEFELVAVVDPQLMLPVSVPAFTSVEECLAQVKAEAAVVATPLSTHRQLGLQLLSADLHVFMEKPVAESSSSARLLKEKATEMQKCLFVGHSERYNPAFQVFLQAFHQGITGPLYRVEGKRVGPFPQRIGDTGVALDLAVHDLDAIVSLLQSPPEWVFAHSEQRIHPQFEDGINAMMGFPNDVLAQLSVNWLSPQKKRYLNAYGHNGMLQCNFFERKVLFYENNYQRSTPDDFGLSGIESGECRELVVENKEPLLCELEVFAKRCQGGMVEAEFSSAYQAVLIAEQLLQSAKQKTILNLK